VLKPVGTKLQDSSPPGAELKTSGVTDRKAFLRALLLGATHWASVQTRVTIAASEVPTLRAKVTREPVTMFKMRLCQ